MFVRLGFEGYAAVQQAARDVAGHIAERVAELGPFRLVTTGSELPVVAFTTTEEITSWDVFAVSRGLREHGWQVPAYTFPANREDLAVHADGPAWLDAPAAERRSLVWQAMGFVNAGLGVTSPDALALLRAYAYSEGMDLDELAVRVLDRDVSLQLLALDADPSR